MSQPRRKSAWYLSRPDVMSYYQVYQPSSHNSTKVGLLLIHTRCLGGGSSRGHCQLVGLRNAISMN
jgi:hypothetical protein